MIGTRASARGATFGRRVVDYFGLHGRVSGLLGSRPFAARAAGSMLDAALASPGAQLTFEEAREPEVGTASTAAVRFRLTWPQREGSETLWVLVELARDGEVVRGTSSLMTRRLLTGGFRP